MAAELTTASLDRTGFGSGRERKLPAGSDLPYRILLGAFTVVTGAILILFLYSIAAKSVPGWQTAGWSFFTSTNWNPTNGDYGAIPLIVGTFLSTIIALFFAVPVAIGAAMCIVFLVPRRFAVIVATFVELLAVIPSIVYGVWGLQQIGPWFSNTTQPWLAKITGGGFPFSGAEAGQCLLLGGLVLGVMILPTVTALSRDTFAAVPNELVEGALSLGASRGQVLRRIVLPSSRTGILAATTLGTGRALGETIAMVFLLGGVSTLHPIPPSLFSPVGTLASEIANDWGNVTSSGQLGVIFCLALVLMLIVGLVNLSARIFLHRSEAKLR